MTKPLTKTRRNIYILRKTIVAGWLLASQQARHTASKPGIAASWDPSGVLLYFEWTSQATVSREEKESKIPNFYVDGSHVSACFKRGRQTSPIPGVHIAIGVP